MKAKLPSIILALVGVIFLVPSVMLLIKGEPLSFSPAVAAGVGLLLGAVVAAVFRRLALGS